MSHTGTNQRVDNLGHNPKAMTSPQSLKPNEAVSQVTQLYHFTFDPEAKQVSAIYQGITLADSNKVMLLQETRIAPICYFPREDVRMDLFEPGVTLHTTRCASVKLQPIISSGVMKTRLRNPHVSRITWLFIRTRWISCTRVGSQRSLKTNHYQPMKTRF